MATAKFKWKVSTNRYMGIFVNGELLASTDVRDVRAIAQAKGEKNIGPYELKKNTVSLKGAEFKAKSGDNFVELKQKGLKDLGKAYAPIKGAKSSFQVSDNGTVKVTVKKRGLPIPIVGTLMRIILGKYQVKVKAD